MADWERGEHGRFYPYGKTYGQVFLSKSNRRSEAMTGTVERKQRINGGKIDVYNAGSPVGGPTETSEIESFDAMFAANVRAPFFLVAAFAPGMVARGSGSIINIGSMASRLGLAGGAAYGDTKAAVASLTQAWAAEYSPRGVRVNTVAPGPIYTRPEARAPFDTLGATTAMKRAADPAEIAEVVAFLASREPAT